MKLLEPSKRKGNTDMASVRLTQDMRKTILGRLMSHAFDKRLEQQRKEASHLGDDVYEDIYHRDLQKKMRALPDGFLKLTGGITVCFGGRRSNVSFSKMRPVAECHDTYEGARSYDASHELSVRHFETEKQGSVLREEMDRVRSLAKAALDSCTTLKNLVEAWPEAAPFVKDFAKSRPVLALTVTIKDLNSKLGLSK